MEPQYVRELSTVYPHPVWRPVTALLYIASLVILSSMITRRMPTWREWREKRVTLVKAAVVLLLVVSLLFVGTAMLLVHGVGLSSSIEACTAAGWTSILLYEPSKGIIVFFLIERVHIITAHGTAMRRRDSKMYIFNITLLAACVSTLILACVYFRAEIRESDYTCVYHNNPKILAWGIAQDLGVNLWLTCLFAYPLYRGQSRSRKVKALAIKSIVVCFMMMLFVFANLMVFLLSNGREVGWVLLAAFSLDIMANAIGLFIITSKTEMSLAADPNPTHTLVMNATGETPSSPSVKRELYIDSLTRSRSHVVPVQVDVGGREKRSDDAEVDRISLAESESGSLRRRGSL